MTLVGTPRDLKSLPIGLELDKCITEPVKVLTQTTMSDPVKTTFTTQVWQYRLVGHQPAGSSGTADSLFVQNTQPRSALNGYAIKHNI